MSQIILKTKKEIEIMREGGKILSETLALAKKKIKIGTTGDEIDAIMEKNILRYGALPAFKGFNNFPASVCFSVNNEIVHGNPYGKVLKNGDIVSIDCGVLYKGYYSDAAFTVDVGQISTEIKEMIQNTKKALQVGIKSIIINENLGNVSNAIQKFGESFKYGIVKELCGHGIGKNLHEKPDILNIGEKGIGSKIKEGMVFCLEPMFTLGHWKIKKGKDGFSWETEDGSLSAHFEHTIAITENGPEILTN